MTRFGSSEIQQQQYAVLVPFCVGQQFGPTQANQPLFFCSNYSSMTFTSWEPLLCPQTDTLVSHLSPPSPACSAWCIWVCFICWLLNILLFPPCYLLILHVFPPTPVGSLGFMGNITCCEFLGRFLSRDILAQFHSAEWQPVNLRHGPTCRSSMN